MNASPSTPKPAPTTAYGHVFPPASSGTIRPAPKLTASAVRPLRNQARYVRSFARRVRRVASATPGSASGGVGGVAELAELTGHEIHDLLADVDRVVADPLHTA